VAFLCSWFGTREVTFTLAASSTFVSHLTPAHHGGRIQGERLTLLPRGVVTPRHSSSYFVARSDGTISQFPILGTLDLGEAGGGE
jgi:hypothetical protein